VSAVLDLDVHFQYRNGPDISCAWRHAFDDAQVTVLLGASGSGKTTLLRCLAGLERPRSGHIRFGSDVWFDHARRIHVAPERRHVGLLFQDYALFPHMTVAQNITFGAAGLPRGAMKARLAELVESFHLGGLEQRRPGQLSGGQQQRVALARAVFPRPRLLLLDEPLSALDAVTREGIRDELRVLIRAVRTPTYIVSHDRVDALALGDRTVLLDDGRIVQSGATSDVFAHPSTAIAAKLVGVETVLIGQVVAREAGLATVSVEGRQVRAEAPVPGTAEVALCIRAEDVLIARSADGELSAMNRWRGVVRSFTPEGPFVRVVLDCGFRLSALVTRDTWQRLSLHVDDDALAIVKAASIRVLPRH
jgi:molybdate transport system ATP-binding protein